MWSLVQQSTVASSVGANISATISTPQKGTVLLAAYFYNKVLGTGAISGWTLLQEDTFAASAQSVGVWAKIADGTEGTSIAATATAATNQRLQILEVSGLRASTTTDLLLYSTGQSNVSTSTALTGTVTTGGGVVDAPSLVFEAIGWGSAVTSPTATAVAPYSLDMNQTSSDSKLGVALSTRYNPLSGATQTSWSWTTTSTKGWSAVLLAADDKRILTMGMS